MTYSSTPPQLIILKDRDTLILLSHILPCTKTMKFLYPIIIFCHSISPYALITPKSTFCPHPDLQSLHPTVFSKAIHHLCSWLHSPLSNLKLLVKQFNSTPFSTVILLLFCPFTDCTLPNSNTRLLPITCY